MLIYLSCSFLEKDFYKFFKINQILVMSFSEIRKFLIKMQSDEELKKQVTSSSTADDVALIGQSLGYDFSGDDLLRFNGQKVDKVTVRKVDHPGEYH